MIGSISRHLKVQHFRQATNKSFSVLLSLSNSNNPLELCQNDIYSCRGVSSQTHNDDSNKKDNLRRTCLYDFHLKHGGKMVPFGGWLMPVQYQDGIVTSHLHTRKHASIFDVSHMLQTYIYGSNRLSFMESLTVGDIQGLSDGQGTLTLFTNSNGGIQDDLIVTKMPDYLYVVSNAGCIENDLNLMQTCAAEMRSKGKDVNIEVSSNGLIALQGPDMVKALQPLMSKVNLSDLTFMKSILTSVGGIPDCRVTRCGYTGEDGVEISVATDKTSDLVELLLQSSHTDVRLAGLGCRDSLRLEAGLCLYGNDIDENTTPVEASLLWTVAKCRRAAANFPGADVILKQIKQKPLIKRIGLISTGPPARGGTMIYDQTGNHVGKVTSGIPSPILKKNISMGYVNKDVSKIGTPLILKVRNKSVEAVVSQMPFVPSKYYTKKI